MKNSCNGRSNPNQPAQRTQRFHGKYPICRIFQVISQYEQHHKIEDSSRQKCYNTTSQNSSQQALGKTFPIKSRKFFFYKIGNRCIGKIKSGSEKQSP